MGVGVENRSPYWPVRTARRREGEFAGIELRNPVGVTYWTDEQWSWIYCESLDVLVGGDSPAEAELRFMEVLLQRKLECLQQERSGGENVDWGRVSKYREIL